MTTARLDITISRNKKFSKDFQLTEASGVPKTLVGKKVRMVIKESYETATVLFDLTEANSGIIVVDDAMGQFTANINADDTDGYFF
jgi:hypothetical protein